MQNMLQQWFEEAHSRFWDQKPKSQDSEDFGNTDVKIPYQLWNIGKNGTCSDAAITGIMPPPLMEQQVNSLNWLLFVCHGNGDHLNLFSWNPDNRGTQEWLEETIIKSFSIS